MSKKLLNFLLIISSFAIYYLVISPLYSGVGSIWQPDQGINDAANINTKYDAALDQIKTLSAQADTLQKQYSNFSQDDISKMEVMVPDKVDPIRLLSEVNTVANKTGLILSDLNYLENPISTGSTGTYIISFSVKTSYEKFKDLMRNYETSMRLFTVRSVNFNAPTKVGDIIGFQVKLETSYMKQ